MTEAEERDGFRRVFAMAAAAGMLANSKFVPSNRFGLARNAVQVADALLEALEAEPAAPEDGHESDHKVDLMGRPVRT